MKKIKYLLLLFVTVLCLTGCGKDNSKQELKDAFLKLKGTEAIAFKATINMGSEEMKIPYSIEMSVNDKDMHMKVSVSFAGIMQETEETYVITKDNESYVYTYIAEEDSWEYIKGDAGESVIDANLEVPGAEDTDKAIDKLIDSFDKVKKVKSDKDGYTKYEMTMNKKTLEDIAKEDVTDEEELKEIEESLKMFPDSLTCIVYLKDGELAIVTMDLSKMELPTDMLPEGMNLKIFDITFELLGRNEAVKVELPKEVEENAVQLEAKFDFEDMFGEM